MRYLVVPTAVAGIHFVTAVACMCSAVSGTVSAAAVLVLPDIHCSLAVGAATVAVVGVVGTVASSDAGAVIVAVSLIAGYVAAGFDTWVLSDDVLSTPVIFPVQTCPSPSVLSLSILFQPQLLFHLETFYTARACMHLLTCGRHPF